MLVVLATLVIFGTGLTTGVILIKHTPSNPPVQAMPSPAPPPAPAMMQQFLRRVQGELDLTAEQHQHIETILRDSQDRTRGLARVEFGKVRDQIRSELKPGQRDKFERLLRQRQRRAQEMMSQENRPPWRPNNPTQLDGSIPNPVNR